MKKNEQMKMTKAHERSTTLRFSPTAWAKLLFLRDMGDTEIGGFGITPADDLLFVEDVQLVRQTCSWISVEFDDDAVADFFDAQVDAGRRPEEFGRLWVHTHPGNSPSPSSTDERTFQRVFGTCDWAVMFILARGGQTYCRLRFSVGPGGEMTIPVEVDYLRPFDGSDHDAWRDEYLSGVHIPPPEPKKIDRPVLVAGPTDEEPFVDDWYDAWGEYLSYDGLPMEDAYGYIRDF